jgi:hypothetical protein
MNTNKWSLTAPLLMSGEYCTGAVLANGLVLKAGGVEEAGIVSTVELFDVSTRTWKLAGNMLSNRGLATWGHIPPNQIIVAGGSSYHALDTCEVFDFCAGPFPVSSPKYLCNVNSASVSIYDVGLDGIGAWVVSPSASGSFCGFNNSNHDFCASC